MFPKIRLEEFKKLPIPKNETSATELAEIVNQIISAKADNASVNASLLENKLDKFVYKIYGLTENEIKIIEQR